MPGVRWHGRIEAVQDYVAASVIRSLLEGAVLLFLLLLAERLTGQRHKKALHRIYQFALALLLLSSLAGEAICGYASKFRHGLADISLDSRFYSLVFISWIAGVLLFGFRWIVSWRKIMRLLDSASGSFPARWHIMLEDCSADMRLAEYPRILHRRGIASAFVHGVYRPVIVFPTAWINGLTAEEAECVIRHEMAHLRSMDHWWNVLMMFSETLLFFNPAVHFITGRMRLQRELCADETVIISIGNRFTYAKTLVSLGEELLAGRMPAFLAAPRQLTIRVKEILQPGLTGSRQSAGWMMLLVGITGAFLLNTVRPAELQVAYGMSNLSPDLCVIETKEVPDRYWTVTGNKPLPQAPSSPDKLIIAAKEIKENRTNTAVAGSFPDHDGIATGPSTENGDNWRTTLYDYAFLKDLWKDTASVGLVIRPWGESSLNSGITADRFYGPEKGWRTQWNHQRPNGRFFQLKGLSRTMLGYSSGYQAVFQNPAAN